MPRLKDLSQLPPRPPIVFNRGGMKELRQWGKKKAAIEEAIRAQREEGREVRELSAATQGLRRKWKKLLVYGRRVDPAVPEARLMRVKWVKDCGVTARGQGDDRRLVCFVVLEAGRLLGDVEDDLRLACSTLPAYYRPQAYTQVARLPRDPVLGDLQRHVLVKGTFDGRVFNQRTGKRNGRGKAHTITIRNPINEVRYEGSVAYPVQNRRHGDPAEKVRPNEARVTLSHRLPGQSTRNGMCVTFLFKGEVAKEAKKLEVGERICVTGRITTESNARQFLGVAFTRVEASTERVNLQSTDSVIEALL